MDCAGDHFMSSEFCFFDGKRKRCLMFEVNKAKRLGREMFPDEECGQLIDPVSSHCPRQNQRKRQKSKAKPKQPTSRHSSATPSTQECSNPISLPISMINNSTPNPQYGGFLHPTPSSSGEHLTAPLPSCGSSISPQQELALHQIGPTAQNLQHGGFVHSSFYSGGHLTSPIPSGSSLISPYGLAFQQTALVTPQYPFSTVVTWHSGMSPHKYEGVVLKPCVKNCYGCFSKLRRCCIDICQWL